VHLANFQTIHLMSYSIYYLVKCTKKLELNSPAFKGGLALMVNPPLKGVGGCLWCLNFDLILEYQSRTNLRYFLFRHKRNPSSEPLELPA
jgi:hypothetical protein